MNDSARPRGPPSWRTTWSAATSTSGPEAIGGVDQYGSPGIVVLGSRAYLVENYFYGGTLKVYDTSDPAQPRLLDSSQSVTGRPVDIAGGVVDDEAVLDSKGGLVAVATGPPARSVPSNLYLFDARAPQPRWIGAASLTTGAQDGTIQRLVLRNGRAYAATQRKGVQVVDLGQVVAAFRSDRTTTEYWDMVRALNTDGQGFGQGAVQYSIPVKTLTGVDAYLNDLKVGDFTDASANVLTLAIATGTVALAIVDTVAQRSQPHRIQITDPGTQQLVKLTQGYALDIGEASGKRLAVLAGAGTIAGGTSTSVVAVVDLTDPAVPKTLAIVPISSSVVAGGATGNPVDVLLRPDGTVLVGTTRC